MNGSPKKKTSPTLGLAASVFLSLHTTVICLIILCILVFWGTLYQVDHGIYAAKARFFSAWIVMIGGIIPFPGVRLVGSALILNQATMLVFKQQWRPDKAGLIITHIGILVLLAGGGIVSYTARETFLTLWEGETSCESLSYNSWELAASELAKDGRPEAILVLNLDTLKAGQSYRFGSGDVSLGIENTYKNCTALMPSSMTHATRMQSNAMPSAADSIEPEKPAADPSDNVPGAIVSVTGGGAAARAVLYGGVAQPVRVPCGAETLSLSIRRKPTRLPLRISLLRFVKEDYAGTQMARQYRSAIHAKGPDIDRDVVVSMNKPFRYRQYAFYQSSYSQSIDRRSSTLAVVENRGKWLPYIASFLMSLGLLLHFGTKLVAHVRKRRAS
jgi:hypothetical protein